MTCNLWRCLKCKHYKFECDCTEAYNLRPGGWLTIAAAVLLLGLTACTLPLTPELIEALSKDNASFCGRAGIRGGAGAMPLVGGAVPVGGYGSSEFEFCRSNYEDATVSMAPNGPITITHGAQAP